MPTLTEWTGAAVVAKAEADAILTALVAGIRRDAHQIWVRSENESRRHAAELRAIDIDRAAVCKRCPHPDTTYVGDPSGNSYSCTQCNICGDHW